jgi:hypothetical protein
MSFSDRISSLQSSAEQQLHALGSKKETENALVLPFVEALGYNPFDVRQVEPDYEIGPGDPGAKAVDYALKTEDAPAMLVQCAEAKTDLGDFEAAVRREGSLLAQLGRLQADLIAVTNGLTYRFYADLEAGLTVEPRPFLEFNLLGYEAAELKTLKRLSRPVFDREEIRRVAHDRCAGRRLRRYLAEQRESPDDHFVRFLAAQVYDGDISGRQLGRLRPLIQEVLGEVIEEDGEGRPGTPDTEQEGRSHRGQPEEPAATDLEIGSERASVGDGAPADPEEDGSGPFDKNLAERVIEEF